MALQPLGNSEELTRALVAAYNALLREYVEDQTTFPHADIMSTAATPDYRSPVATPLLVTAANASSLATLRSLCQDFYRIWSKHIGDAVAHKAADATNTIAAGLPADDADQTTLNTFLNQAKAAFNGHASQAGVHFTNDGTNAIAAADATDAATSYTLANELKADINLHVQFGPSSPAITIRG